VHREDVYNGKTFKVSEGLKFVFDGDRLLIGKGTVALHKGVSPLAAILLEFTILIARGTLPYGINEAGDGARKKPLAPLPVESMGSIRFL